MTEEYVEPLEEATPFCDALIPAPGSTGNQLVLDYRPGTAPTWQPGEWVTHADATWLVDHRETTGDGTTRIQLIAKAKE